MCKYTYVIYTFKHCILQIGKKKKKNGNIHKHAEHDWNVSWPKTILIKNLIYGILCSHYHVWQNHGTMMLSKVIPYYHNKP